MGSKCESESKLGWCFQTLVLSDINNPNPEMLYGQRENGNIQNGGDAGRKDGIISGR